MRQVQEDGQGSIKLPFYQCHKKVQAAKISEIRELVGPSDTNGRIVAEPSGYFWLRFGEIGASWNVHTEWMDRFKPEVGGYFVLYEDGYTSFSPAKAFEEGYTRI